MSTDTAPGTATPGTAHRKVLLLNGPNLNLLGQRDPATYGSATLADVEARTVAAGSELGLDVVCRQSNHEGALIDLVQSAPTEGFSGIVINPGAYAHYSYALRDAVDAIDIPCVEIHISNVHAREPFRHTSVTAPVMDGFICGCGIAGYVLALRALLSRLDG
ncbi:MAG TPA: type II 3-dehydroquinate dehydratase [Kineosporiaceae bacterium]|nr:type II 3-dehydroquinate dehydratase [Kineosporiaceae bacterium]